MLLHFDTVGDPALGFSGSLETRELGAGLRSRPDGLIIITTGGGGGGGDRQKGGGEIKGSISPEPYSFI